MKHLFHPKIRLSLYLDDVLSPWQHKRVERHLADCPFCRRQYEQLARVRSTLRQSPSHPVSAAFVTQVLRRYHAQRTANTYWAGFQNMPQLLPQLALLMLLILAMLWSWHPVEADFIDRLNIQSTTTAVLDQTQLETSLTTYDQALQFALTEHSEGEK
jgi:anti-sigma factor RsiW